MTGLIVMAIVLLGCFGFLLFLRWKTDRDCRKRQEEWDAAHPRAQELLDKVKAAVSATTGQVVTYKNQLIEATYFSCSGGRTEDAVAVWGTDVPYLQAVDSPGEEKATHYADTVHFTGTEFARLLGLQLKGNPTTWLGAVTYTDGGGVATMTIGGTVFKGTELRQKLGLSSTAFSLEVVADVVKIVTKGFGHRVGMSQYGAEAMAVGGSSYQEILAYDYPGTRLTDHSQN